MLRFCYWLHVFICVYMLAVVRIIHQLHKGQGAQVAWSTLFLGGTDGVSGTSMLVECWLFKRRLYIKSCVSLWCFHTYMPVYFVLIFALCSRTSSWVGTRNKEDPPQWRGRGILSVEGRSQQSRKEHGKFNFSIQERTQHAWPAGFQTGACTDIIILLGS